VLLLLLWLAVAGYAAAVLWLMSQETKIVFQAIQTLGDARPPFPYEQIELPHADGARQFAWLMQHDRSEAAAWVLYLHGNPSTIASSVNIAHYRMLREIGFNIVAPEYRGFAGLEGSPTESGLRADAHAAYDYLRVTRRVPPSRIVVYGWSLGSSVAIDLASRVELAAVVAEGAPASMVDINQRRYPFFPVRLVMRNRFESIGKIDRVTVPILFLHSREDSVIAIADARRLYEAAPGPKRFVEVRGGHVGAIEQDGGRFSDAIRSFLSEQGVLGPAQASSGSLNEH
jgi:pimeloyl-ACP methyl ester carboxylesterase